MKNLKHILGFALILMLTLSLSAPAFADGPQYKNTKTFLSKVAGDEEFSCEYNGVYDLFEEYDVAALDAAY